MTIISLGVPVKQEKNVLDADWGEVKMEARHMKYNRHDIESVPQKEWLIENVLGPKDIVFVYGQPSTGKTFVVIDLMMSVISDDGRLFANTFRVTRPLTVAMVVGEGGTSIRDRLVAADRHANVSKDANYFIFANGLQLYEDDDGEEIDSFINEWQTFEKGRQLDILIIDTYAMSTVGADENSAKATGKVLSNARKISEALGCAVVFVHHTTKNGSAERGSSSLRAAADMMIEVGGDAIRCTKAKHCETWKPIEFKLIPFENSLVVRWDNESMLEGAIVAWFNESVEQRFVMNDITTQFGSIASHMTIKNTVKKLVGDGVIGAALRNASLKNSPTNPMTYFVEEF